jgi:NCS1 family nucleobase:cation symporter-1
MRGHTEAEGAGLAVTDAAVAKLNEEAAGGGYWNADLAPVPPSARRWGLKDVAALWVALAACIPTYMLASSLIEEGMSWSQAVLTIFLGNLIVLVPLVLNAHAGTRYGIPFPVYCRAAFGVRGANVPALLRALVACGWFGIQCWIGGWAIYKVLEVYFPAWQSVTSCSRSCVSRGWTPPTGRPSWRSASASSCARSGTAAGPGPGRGRRPC